MAAKPLRTKAQEAKIMNQEALFIELHGDSLQECDLCQVLRNFQTFTSPQDTICSLCHEALDLGVDPVSIREFMSAPDATYTKASAVADLNARWSEMDVDEYDEAAAEVSFRDTYRQTLARLWSRYLTYAERCYHNNEVPLLPAEWQERAGNLTPSERCVKMDQNV